MITCPCSSASSNDNISPASAAKLKQDRPPPPRQPRSSCPLSSSIKCSKAGRPPRANTKDTACPAAPAILESSVQNGAALTIDLHALHRRRDPGIKPQQQLYARLPAPELKLIPHTSTFLSSSFLDGFSLFLSPPPRPRSLHLQSFTLLFAVLASALDLMRIGPAHSSSATAAICSLTSTRAEAHPPHEHIPFILLLLVSLSTSASFTLLFAVLASALDLMHIGSAHSNSARRHPSPWVGLIGRSLQLRLNAPRPSGNLRWRLGCLFLARKNSLLGVSRTLLQKAHSPRLNFASNDAKCPAYRQRPGRRQAPPRQSFAHRRESCLVPCWNRCLGLPIKLLSGSAFSSSPRPRPKQSQEAARERTYLSLYGN
eukprot:tig00001177_g7360.t1